jgi:hypothetical protein
MFKYDGPRGGFELNKLPNDFINIIDARAERGVIAIPESEKGHDKEAELMEALAGFIDDEDTKKHLLYELESYISELTGVYSRYAYIQGLRDARNFRQLLG